MGNTELEIYFSKEDIEYIKQKFDIENEDDLRRAVYECVSTYMEL